MGYNTPVLILNDAMHMLETDPKVGRKMYEAIGESYGGKGVSFGIGNYCNGGYALPSMHADDVQVVAIGGNCMKRLGVVYGGWHLMGGDNTEKLMRQLADSLGYRLVKKAVKS